ncbi:MAG: V-type ATP synthase subunit F [Candidatus Heimdallarchaeota archaeon]
MTELSSSKKVFVIGARETVRGFNLIGILGKEVKETSEAIELLEKILQEDYSLVIISASVAFEMQDIIDDYRIVEKTPIIIVSDLNMKVEKRELEKKFRKFIGI